MTTKRGSAAAEFYRNTWKKIATTHTDYMEFAEAYASAQARIASATTFLRRADATSTQNELYDLLDDTRRALAEPQSGEK